MRTNIAPWDYAKPRIFRPNYRCPTCGAAASKTRVVDEMLVICLKRRPCKTITLDAQAIQKLINDYDYQHNSAPDPQTDPRSPSEREMDNLADDVAAQRMCARFGCQL